MKFTRLPDEPTPDRRFNAKPKSSGRRSTNLPMGYHGSSTINPIWDERQLALIEEFKQRGPNPVEKRDLAEREFYARLKREMGMPEAPDG